MITYIKSELQGFYAEFNQELDPELYTNTGTTYEDFLQNKWIKLSDEQVAFHTEYPNASIKEVLSMEIIDNTPIRTLEQAKSEKLNEISMYDMSENVNSFSVNETINTWLTVQERLNYQQSINVAKLMNQENISFFIDNYQLTVSTEQAAAILAALQIYADTCFIKTKQHKLAVQNLETVEEVDSYDYTAGYPEKLNFTI